MVARIDVRAASDGQTVAGPRAIRCDRTTAVTRSLLGYGVVAGLTYVGVSLVQALTRDGFDLSRHAWSLLSTGGLGWIQITNFVLSGLMTVAFAVGLRRALGGSGRGAVTTLGFVAAVIIAWGLDLSAGRPPLPPPRAGRNGSAGCSWRVPPGSPEGDPASPAAVVQYAWVTVMVTFEQEAA